MAIKSLGSRRVTVEGKTKGVESATKAVGKLGKTTTEAAKTANTAKRKQEALHKESLASGKAFSRQAQGLGGLVRAYATIAANIFALTSAYAILRRAADHESMIKSAENLEARLGTSVTNIAKKMQVASGHALDFRQSLENTNRALSAGFDQSQIEALTDVVAKASQTFGGSVEANMNKAINAVLRGRTETLSTMGIVIDINKAYTDYAATLGRTAGELTKYHQQQAVINALLTEGAQTLDGVELDPNPFQKLANTLFDTAQDITSVIVKVSQPLIELINTSKKFAGAIIATLGAIFASKLTPDAEAYFASAQKATRDVTQSIIRNNRIAKKSERDFYKRREFLVEKAKEAKRRELIEWVNGERGKVKSVDEASKTMQVLFKEVELNGKNAFINIEKEQRRALGTMQTNLTKFINDTSDKSVMAPVRSLSVGGAKDLRGAIDIVRDDDQRRLNREIEKTVVQMGFLEKAWVNVGHQSRLAGTHAKRSFAMQRRGTHSLIQQYGILTGTAKAYTLILRGAESDTRKYIASNGALGASFKVVALAARGTAATVTLLSAALNKLPFIIGTITTLMFAWKWISSKLGIGETSKDMEEFTKVSESLGEVLEKTNQRLEDFQKLTDRTANTGISGLTQQMNHLRNSIGEVLEPMGDVQGAFGKFLFTEDGKFVGDAINDISNALSGVSGANVTLPNFDDIVSGEGFMKRTRDHLNLFFTTTSDTQKAALEKSILTMFERLGIDGDFKDVRDTLNDMISINQINIDHMQDILPGVLDSIVNANKSMVRMLDNAVEGGGDTLRRQQEAALSEFAESQADELAKDMIERFNTALRFGDVEGFKRWVARQLSEATSEGAIQILALVQEMFNVVGRPAEAVRADLGSIVASGTQVTELMTSITALRAQKGNVFFDKAGVAEEVKILQGMSLALKDMPEFSKQDFFRSLMEDTNTVEFFNLQNAKDFDDIVGRLDNQLNTFRKFAESNVFVSMAEEIRKSERALLGIQLERTSNLEEIKRITAAQSQIDKDSLSAEIDLNEQKMHSLEIQRRMVGITAEQARIHAREIDVLKRQNEVLTARRELISPETDGLIAANEALISRQNARLAAMNNEIGAMQQLKGLLGDTTSIYQQQAVIFERRAKALELQADNVRNQMQGIELNMSEGRFTTEDLNRLINLEGQIVQLMAQQIALAREEFETNIRNRANDGDIEANRQSFMLEFIKAGEDLAKNMISAGERAAKGIATTVHNTFDMVVDKLLDGTSGFLEAFKGILRESLGEFLKTNIQQLTTNMMADMARTVFGDAIPDPAQDPSIKAMQELVEAIRKNTEVLSGSVSTETGGPQIPSNIITEITGNLEAPEIVRPLNGILNNTQEAVAGRVAEEMASNVMDPIHITEKALLGTMASNTTLILTGITQANAWLAQIAATSAAGGGTVTSGIFAGIGSSLLPAANGAIIQGGLNRYAKGTITDGPELALIGEGRNREAVIPMPNNREVPVQLLGGGETLNVEINNSYDFKNATPNSEANLRTQAEMIKRDTFNRVFSEINKGGRYAKMTGRR